MTVSCKYLGYTLTNTLTDDEHMKRQARRLYSLYHNLNAQIELDLLPDDILRSLTSAYSNIYLLPILDNYRKSSLKQLSKAHRFFVANLTRYYKRSALWNPEKGLFDQSNTSIYGRLGIPKFSVQMENQKSKFQTRYENYLIETGQKNVFHENNSGDTSLDFNIFD